MPQVLFRVRWPDDSVHRCYSPSTVIEEYFRVGGSSVLTEFVALSRKALTEASERVRAGHGFGCARAEARLAGIELKAAGFADQQADIVVEGYER